MGKRGRDTSEGPPESDSRQKKKKRLSIEIDETSQADVERDHRSEKKKKNRHEQKIGEVESVMETSVCELQENHKETKKKKHKHKTEAKLEDAEPVVEAGRDPAELEDAKKRKRKKHKHSKEVEVQEPIVEAVDDSAELEQGHRHKRKKHKHKEEADISGSSAPEPQDNSADLEEDPKKKRKKHKHKKGKESLEEGCEQAHQTNGDSAELGDDHKERRHKHKRKKEKADDQIVDDIVEDSKEKRKRKKRKEKGGDAGDAPAGEEATAEARNEGGEEKRREDVDEETKEKQKQEWKERISVKKLKMQQPKMFLIDNFTNDEDERAAFKPVEMQDLQDVIQYATMGNAANKNKVSFCKLVRPVIISKVVVLVLNGMSDRCFQDNRDCFTHLTSHYDLTGEIRQFQQKDSLVNQLLQIAISRKMLRKQAYFARQAGQSAQTMPPAKIPATVSSTAVPKRTHYLLKDEEKAMWRYPDADDPAYVHTKHGAAVTDSSPLISVDCEMCVTKNGSELTRVSVIDEKYNVLYNSLVKPRNPIIDYVTRYSGITKELLDPVTKRLEDVQREIIALLPLDAILVGQSLENDLRALKLYHPFVIDTSNLFTGSYRVALRKLAWKYLGVTIQAQDKGHDSVEDAAVTLKLLQLKIEKGESLPKYHSNSAQHQQPYTIPTESLFQGIQSLQKVSMMVDSTAITRQFVKDPVGPLACQNDSEALKKALQAISHSDFVWVQLHNFFKLTQGISLESAVVKETLRQLDQRIKKIYKKLPFNSFFLVVMARDPIAASGKSDNIVDELANGRFFMGLKVKY